MIYFFPTEKHLHNQSVNWILAEDGLIDQLGVKSSIRIHKQREKE